ncbi:BZ3501_MvSof-1269-A2-R1_Chr1-1g00813 [Microbotryum saponariae]|nr:BZ3501_MvSof-1269-A2-R1_Chr1-1g00813 [Microbotryum saponariae]
MSTPSDAPTSSQISLTDLTLEQLHQVRQQLDQELQHLTNAFQELRLAQVKFAAALESLDSLKKANQDKNILIPLTSSLYVPGKIKDPEHVLVDIGTGYYVEKVRIPHRGNHKQSAALRHELNLKPPPPPPSLSSFAQTTKQAKTYYNQKNLTLRSSLATLQSQIEKKEDNMRAAMSVYNQKVAREGGARAARADGGEDR